LTFISFIVYSCLTDAFSILTFISRILFFIAPFISFLPFYCFTTVFCIFTFILLTLTSFCFYLSVNFIYSICISLISLFALTSLCFVCPIPELSLSATFFTLLQSPNYD
jgi:hypothetical protein